MWSRVNIWLTKKMKAKYSVTLILYPHENHMANKTFYKKVYLSINICAWSSLSSHKFAWSVYRRTTHKYSNCLWKLIVHISWVWRFHPVQVVQLLYAKFSFSTSKDRVLLVYAWNYISNISSSHSLKGLFTNFWYIPFFSCLNKRNIFYKRSISIKQLRNEKNLEN